MRDYQKSQEIVKTEVVNYQKSTGKEVYLDKQKYWFYVGALTYSSSYEYDAIISDLKRDISKLEVKEKYNYKRQFPINA